MSGLLRRCGHHASDVPRERQQHAHRDTRYRLPRLQGMLKLGGRAPDEAAPAVRQGNRDEAGPASTREGQDLQPLPTQWVPCVSDGDRRYLPIYDCGSQRCSVMPR
jgi:hypothetical protein